MEGWEVIPQSPLFSYLLKLDVIHLQSFPLPLNAPPPRFQGMSVAQAQMPLKLLPSWPDPRNKEQFDYSLKSLDFDRKPCPGATFRYIELFAGIGGFRLALDKLGGICVFANEIDQDATDVYRANFSDNCLECRPIEEVDAKEIPPFDILTGGFPCQPFSRLGSQPAFRDEKGQLFFQIVRIVHYHEPRAIILENVPGLLYADDGRVFHGVLNELCGLGYRVGVTTINSSTFLPQCRRRVYFVAVKNSEPHFPLFPSLPSLRRQLKAVLEPNPDPSRLLTKTRVLATERKMHRYLARKKDKLEKPHNPDETAKGGAEHWIRTWEKVEDVREFGPLKLGAVSMLDSACAISYIDFKLWKRTLGNSACSGIVL